MESKAKDVICITSEAFDALLEKILCRIDEKFRQLNQKQWINSEEAMSILNISSKTTLQKLRDEGKIRYSHPYKKILLYDRNSLLEYIEAHARETF